MNILLVEDDEGIATITTYVLEEAGHKVFRAHDQAQIEEHLAKNMIRILLMDVSLQVGDGSKICRRIKIQPAYSSLPIVLMSAHQDLKEIAQKALADAYLKKPFDIEDLLGVISEFAV